MELGLRGRVAIVTGATRGIGRACVDVLLDEGVDVCAVGRDPALLAALGERRPRVEPVAADLSQEEGCDRAVAACLEAFGRVDILVNSAGAAGVGPVLDLPIERIEDALRLKLYGYLRMAQRVAPHMQAAGWGRIVNIAGVAGTSPTAGNMPTSLANIGVLNVTRALSDALAGDGVLVNAVCPGLTRTDRARRLFVAAAESAGREVDELIAEAGAALPGGRCAEPVEVARVVAFLASDACSYLYASALYMDGGARRSTP